MNRFNILGKIEIGEPSDDEWNHPVLRKVAEAKSKEDRKEIIRFYVRWFGSEVDSQSYLNDPK